MAEPAISEYFNTQNPLIRVYFFYVSILALKVLAMSFLTSVQRIKNKTYANPEDAAPRKVKVKVSEDVERVRRAHLNDLENIPVFFVVSFAYILTNPSVTLATLLFRIFTLARIAHTFVYAVVVIPQPARGLSWIVGFAVTAYMAVVSILHFI